ncbi:MAG: ABC transporter substrate-binding protein [Acidimicrobiales bacterium]
MKRRHTGALRLVGLLAVASLVAAACGSSTKNSTSTTSSGGSTSANTASAPGITATTITIGSHQPLTGVAAPGYSEIAPSSNAFFQYVNSKGGVHGRTIKYNYLDDGYNPANTVTVVRKLVQQDHVFAIFNGLGTPTHTAVEPFLNAEHVPDLFVASGCLCWDNISQYPWTSGWQTDYEVEGKIQGQYIKDHFAGKKVGYLYQNDDFGQNGIKGLNQEIPASQVVSSQSYDVTNTNIAPQISALQSAGAQVVVMYTVPAFTALALLAANTIGYHPTVVVSNVGADPTTVGGLVSAISKGAANGSATDGLITDGYLPSVNDTANPWVQLFKKIHDQYVPNLPFDGNVEYGMAVADTFVNLMKAAGNNPTRQGVIDTLRKGLPAGPGLVPFRFSKTSSAGYTGAQMGTISGGKLTLSGPVYTAADTGPISTYSGGLTPVPSFLQ